ncbi:MAG: hypothetical protein PSX81_02190 [bacterium]|nr:hypothetical protein [bacterium]
MKKTTVILLLFAITFSNTELHQLLKIPQLVSHFVQHKKVDSQISFIDFLTMHYNDSENEISDKQHDNLPFKSHCTIVFHSIIAEVVNTGNSIEIDSFFLIKGTINYKEAFYTSRLTESIWQPPKFA